MSEADIASLRMTQARSRALRLLRVELDDELFLRRDGNVRA
jgi:hypothetical protein